MEKFTADMHCPRCRRITPHRVFRLVIYRDDPVVVRIGHLCLQPIEDEHCFKYREDVLFLADFNALVRLSNKDYPNE